MARTRSSGRSTDVLPEQARARVEELTDRAGEQLRERGGEAVTRGGELAQRAAGDLEPAVTQARVGLWQAVRVLAVALGALPTLLLRGLRALAGTADRTVERYELDERARAATSRLPRRAPRVRRRTALIWVGAAAVAGFGVGAWLGARQASAGWDGLQEDEPETIDIVDVPEESADARAGEAGTVTG